MTISLIFIITLSVLLLGAVLYWELVVAEGAHLGAKAVIKMYDWTAKRYDGIKQFEPEFEAQTLGYPLSMTMVNLAYPRILDVAAGTGRLARALHAQPAFRGQLVAVDLSMDMLKAGIPTHAQPVDSLQCPAGRLPFDDNTFDVVACLEALEFMPDPLAVIEECIRVLEPGGLLLISNRRGWEAKAIVGKTWPKEALQPLLENMGLFSVDFQSWQVDYDLIWANKLRR